MHENGRRIFGVITANVADIEQREILCGIIARAQADGIDIAVISNIYNPPETAEVLRAENGIYDLIASEEFDGLILITESILNPDVQARILALLKERSEVPVVAAGAPIPGFSLPGFHCINTSDEDDLEDITTHLIEAHGMTDLHILTGPAHLDASRKRVDGYRRALQAHGIPCREETIFYGDFWLDTGKAQAQRYLSGEADFPQALICCNDYMAYGFLDECMEQGVPIPERTAVIGYEYVRERRSHTPLLTSYRRSRRELGEAAVRLLCEKLDTGVFGSFSSTHGELIPGDTCGCGARPEDTRRELWAMQTRANYDLLNLYSQLEHRLTECRSIEEFAACCRDFRFMIRGADRLFLCLYEHWYEGASTSGSMVCYDLLYEAEPFIFRKNSFSCLFRDAAAPYYFCPLFFSDRELGYVVLRFDHPDTFDHIFRNWLKSISNGLEFLRMKNDIRYLTECQNLSAQRDTLTGMYNARGLYNAFTAADRTQLHAVALRIGLFSSGHDSAQELAYATLDAAEAVRQLCGNHDVCGRVSDDTFLCLVRCDYGAPFLEGHLAALLCQHRGYTEKLGLDSFVCCAVPCADASYEDCVSACTQALDAHIAVLSQRRCSPHYRELSRMRGTIYRDPAMTFDTEAVYALFGGSKGYLRQIYKNCYGFTLHDDCTAARMARARCLLALTVLGLAEIAQACGYHDTKYFMRQFQQETGVTAVQYRSMTQ
ncbi:MAG: substrate-binding domain-containing protein [Oscillospiraceae bacterium]|nr:substrate-binding domain-containing protein [Oscillospiraceae bacterium]